MKRENIVNELMTRGYRAQVTENVKNGVIMKGILISGESRIAPIIYTDELIREAENNGDDVRKVANEIIRIYENHRQQDFDIDILRSRDFILEHLYIGVQKESMEMLVKKPSGFDGIEAYLFMRWGQGFSVKIKNELLKIADISVEEAWKRAEKAVYDDTKLTTIGNILGGMGEFPTEEQQMYVVTNKQGVKGASAILNKQQIKNVAKRCGKKRLVMLPSSVHEVLLIPYDDSMDIGELSGMVASINETVVAPEDRLTDRAYVIEI